MISMIAQTKRQTDVVRLMTGQARQRRVRVRVRGSTRGMEMDAAREGVAFYGAMPLYLINLPDTNLLPRRLTLA